MALLNSAARSALASGRLAHLATIDPDGSPQMSAVWVGLDGDDIVTGHLMGGRKAQNIARDPRVTLTMETEGDNGIGMANYLMIRGTARLVEGGAVAADRLRLHRPRRQISADGQSPSRARHPHHPDSGGRVGAVEVTDGLAKMPTKR